MGSEVDSLTVIAHKTDVIAGNTSYAINGFRAITGLEAFRSYNWMTDDQRNRVRATLFRIRATSHASGPPLRSHSTPMNNRVHGGVLLRASIHAVTCSRP